MSEHQPMTKRTTAKVGDWIYIEVLPDRNLWLEGRAKIVAIETTSPIVGDVDVVFDLYLEGNDALGTQDMVIQSVYPLDAVWFFPDEYADRFNGKYAHMDTLPREVRP